MSKPSEIRRGPWRAAMRRRAPLLAALVLLVATGVQGGVTVAPAAPEAAQAKAPQPIVSDAGAYQIRCWQHGRLLFEERITLPADGAAYGIRLSGTDSAGRPMYVAETGNATCLVRAAHDEPRWPR